MSNNGRVKQKSGLTHSILTAKQFFFSFFANLQVCFSIFMIFTIVMQNSHLVLHKEQLKQHFNVKKDIIIKLK